MPPSLFENIHYYYYENHDMAIAMSSSRADPVPGLNIPFSCPGWGVFKYKYIFRATLHWLEVFKCLNQLLQWNAADTHTLSQ